MMRGLNYVFKKYTGSLRNMKWVYVVNNLLNANKLRRNKAIYKKYGLNKSVFAPIGSQVFKGRQEMPVWTMCNEDDRWEESRREAFTQFSKPMQDKINHYLEDGYLVLEGFFDEQEVLSMKKELDERGSNLESHTNYTGKKIPDIHLESKVIREKFTKNPEILNLLSFLLGKQAIPFQSIGFYEGSEQKAHSDYIHMSTFPDGYLIAAWVALEPCGPDNGQLFYFPKSQKLPIIRKFHYDTGINSWRTGKTDYVDYEKTLEAQLEQSDLEKVFWPAQPGDLLIWNAHFVHGGSAIMNKGASRKSIVSHYFGEGVICYHDITQRPALLHK